jgi:hypothetical protein
MSVFEVRMMRLTFVSKDEEVMEERRKLHNEKIHAYCSSSDVIWAICLRTEKSA